MVHPSNLQALDVFHTKYAYLGVLEGQVATPAANLPKIVLGGLIMKKYKVRGMKRRKKYIYKSENHRKEGNNNKKWEGRRKILNVQY